MLSPKPLPQGLPSLWRILKYFWPHARQYRALITGSLAALFAEVALRLLEPWPIKFVFDHILGSKISTHTAMPEVLKSLDTTSLLTLAALAVITFTALRALASYWQTIGFTLIGNRALAKVRAQLYRHVQYLSLSFHTTARTGDLVVRMMGDVGMLQDVAVTAFLPLIGKALIVASMIGLMFFMNWKLALIAAAVLPLFWLRSVSLGRRLREVAKRQRRQEGALAAQFTESLNAIKTVQALSLEESFARAFTQVSEKNLSQDVKGKRLSAALERSLDVLIALATSLVLWCGTRLAQAGDIREFTLESLRAQISVVLQDNVLFAASVRDNIACAAPGAASEQIFAAARLANAHEFIAALPQGYDTILGERGVTLSHGQRQRLAIARAAIRRAPILILDEPTTGLDTKNEREVLEALERLYAEQTTFLITHELSHAVGADWILHLEAGKILERGTHYELMRLNGRYAAMFRAQAGPRVDRERRGGLAPRTNRPSPLTLPSQGGA